MTPYETASGEIDVAAWQESWDRQQEGYLPDREERFAALLDVVDAVADGPAPRVLDLAGGTGSISLRALRRFPAAAVTLLDVDPVLQAIARASFAGAVDGRALVVGADLRRTGWTAAVPGVGAYDAVLTSTALHWLPADRLRELYGEIRELLRPGGVFVNVDHMPDDALPLLTERILARTTARHAARTAAGAVLSWEAWWERAAADPVLGPLVAERAGVFTPGESHTEFTPPVSWHLDNLRAAGYAEAGVVWRGGPDAAVAAIAP